MKLKKGDNVMIIAGKDTGKKGIIQAVLSKENKTVVTGLNLAKHHLKPSRKNPHGGILDIPAPIDASNLILVCPHCGRPTRVAYQITAHTKERICRKCKGNLDTNTSPSLGVKEKNVKS